MSERRGFKRTIRLGYVDFNGTGRNSNEVTVTVEKRWVDGEKTDVYLGKVKGYAEFSFIGDVWNRSRSDILSGGQNDDTIAELFPDSPDIQELVELWRKCHLGGMKAGTALQEQALRVMDKIRKLPESDVHLAVTEALAVLGGTAEPAEFFGEGDGGPLQRAIDWIELVRNMPGTNGYTAALHALETCNLDIDRDYVYGSQWLVQPVSPDDEARIIRVLDRLEMAQPKKMVDPLANPPGTKFRLDHKGYSPKRKMNQFRLIIERGNRTEELWYYAGIGVDPRTVAVKDIMAASFNDASYADMDVADFCDDFGYDLKEGRKVHAACVQTADQLRVLFGRELFNEMLEYYTS